MSDQLLVLWCGLGVVLGVLSIWISELRRKLDIETGHNKRLEATDIKLRAVIRDLEGIDRSRKATLDRAVETLKNQNAALGLDPYPGDEEELEGLEQ